MVKGRPRLPVIPAKAGISFSVRRDSRFRGNDAAIGRPAP